MCTVTAFTTGHGFTVTMNRDESRLRPEKGMHVNNDIMYPVDAEAGGTWMGANSAGVVICLLNRYQDTSHLGAKSRGKIIPRLLQAGDISSVIQKVDALKVKQFNPFDLLVFSQTLSRGYQWNGEDLIPYTLDLNSGVMKTSSSVDTAQVISHRQKLFTHLLEKYSFGKNKEPLIEHVLRSFHLNREPGHGSRSICMERVNTHTKSISQVSISNQSLDFYYTPEQYLNRLVENKKFNEGNSNHRKLSKILYVE